MVQPLAFKSLKLYLYSNAEKTRVCLMAVRRSSKPSTQIISQTAKILSSYKKTCVLSDTVQSLVAF